MVKSFGKDFVPVERYGTGKFWVVRFGKQPILDPVYTEDEEGNPVATGETKESGLYSFYEELLKTDPTVDSVRTLVNNAIVEYDKSDAVNSATLDGETFWFSKADRVGLINGITQQKNNGETTTAIWIGTNKHTMDIDAALDMLSKLELYAIACNDTTKGHLASVAALESVEDICSYDYMSGYPEKLVF